MEEKRRPATPVGQLGALDLDVVFEAVPALVFVVAADDTFVGYRAGASAPLFAPPDAFLGRKVEEVLPAPVGGAALRAIAEARATGRQVCFDYVLPIGDELAHFEARCVPLGLGRVAALVTDVTERVRTRASLRESEEIVRVAFTMSPDAINITRLADGVYIAVNEGFCRATGWREEEAVGRTSAELGIWADRSVRDRLVAAAMAGGSVHNVEVAIRRKDGTLLAGLISTQMVVVGGVPCLLTVTRDITDRRTADEEHALLQDQLRQAQKMEAIGRLAGGVAHDFNNILTSILSTAELLKRSLPPDHPGRGDADQIQEDADRASQLTRHLLAFARRQMVAPKVIRVDERASAMEKMLRRVLGENVLLETRFAEGSWPVLVDPGQLEQVLLNLAVNARDAMPDGGRLTIATDNVAIAAGQQVGALVPGDYLLLTVSDSGAGIPAEILPQIFEPFFTTKGGQGVGLGLATCYGIVRQAGGEILAESAPGFGSRFRVYLPRATAPADEPAAEPGARSLGGRETVLVVEDDPHVRGVAVRALSELGYRVLSAGGAAEAASVSSVHPGPIDILVMDVVLSDGNGRDAALALRASRPETRVLFVSGYAETVLVHRGVAEAGVNFLPKPYTPASLASAVRAVLDAAKPDLDRAGAGRDPRATVPAIDGTGER